MYTTRSEAIYSYRGQERGPASVDASLALLEARISELEKRNLELESHLEALSRKLNNRELQPLERDRGEILVALVLSKGGKMLYSEAFKLMHLSKTRFSILVSKCSALEVQRLRTDRRKKILVSRN